MRNAARSYARCDRHRDRERGGERELGTVPRPAATGGRFSHAYRRRSGRYLPQQVRRDNFTFTAIGLQAQQQRTWRPAYLGTGRRTARKHDITGLAETELPAGALIA